MIPLLALAVVVCVVAALMPLVFLSLIKEWSWYWSWSWSSSWRLTFPALSLHDSAFGRLVRTKHAHGDKGVDDGERGSHTAPFTPLLHHEQECCELDEEDLKLLVSHIEETDGGPPWKLIMEHSTPTLTYQAWYRDPPSGPTQYRTRTVFENVSPELLRDFFWDDEFRPSWDNILISFQTLSVCPQTGTMTVHWIRKLPLFFSDREYVIIRRIWESESGYYCLTKGTQHPSLPKQKRPRVDIYYSSWHIRSVKPSNGDEKMASEVILFHYEDIGLPREIVKMGVRAGMWRMVKRLHAGVQRYKMAKANDGSPSHYALMANTTTRVSTSTITLPNSHG